MRWLIAFFLLSSSSYYLYRRYTRVENPPEVPAVPDAAYRLNPASFLSLADMKRIRDSTSDLDPGVRWAAVELLFAFRDPESVALLEQVIESDYDPELRLKAVSLLKSQGNAAALQGLIRGLSDYDKSVRLASLKAIGEIGDPAASPWVARLLKDPDSDIKMEALATLGSFHEKRKKEFGELAEKLRRQYESAVQKARKAHSPYAR